MWQPSLALLCFHQVSRHCRPVVITRRHHPPQVLECRHRLKCFPVGLKGPLCAVPQLCLRHPPSLPFRSFLAHRGGVVTTVERLPWDHNVALWAPWVWEVSLLQDYHDILYITDIEMHPHCCPCPCYSWAALYRAAPRPSLGREISLVV